MSSADPVRIAVAGAGYWGRNLVRTLRMLPSVALRRVCDPDETVRARMSSEFGVPVVDRFETLLEDPDLEAIAISTPATMHAAQAEAALFAGKHVFVEKPLATSTEAARRVVDAATRTGRVVLVGHILAYHPAVERLVEMVRSGEIGELRYLYAQRVNLGRIRSDENALWSFGPHDLTMVLALVGADPESVSARGRAWLRPGTEDVVFVNLAFPSGVMAQIQLSWLDPHKERRLTVVGSKKMVVFDDAHPTEKLRVYDKGVDRPPDYQTYGDFLTLRDGDIHIPRLANVEPLRAELSHFADCVRGSAKPRTDVAHGLRVVRILASAEASLKMDGVPQRVMP
jgi:predicted dehydrogenase